MEFLDEGAGMLRVAVNAGWTTAQWMTRTTVHTGTRVVRGLAAGESPVSIAAALGAELRSAASALGAPAPPEP
ncbi:MAG: hypothetical protein ACRDSK_29105, partial [Actinophytocola sp.]|uniref:hypothetical protein n=1 Tax=Actinophytocola sp. TaxID=1872138 RepID=UPI003D6AE463